MSRNNKDLPHFGNITAATRAPDGTTTTQVTTLERHFTPDELAEIWHVSPTTVRSWCEEEGGCLVIDRPEGMHKRGYKTVRIPESTAVRIYERRFRRAA
jgi:hypothetical protein